MKRNITRRHFLQSTALTGAGLSLGVQHNASANDSPNGSPKPALLGGKPACTDGFPSWPVYDQTEEKALLEKLHSRQWYRGSGNAVAHFEDAYAKLTGAKHCLATSCGTSATALPE